MISKDLKDSKDIREIIARTLLSFESLLFFVSFMSFAFL
ncbi:MAG: hypothetical protein BWX80_00287 [Candidatus Hydrogenedentes bacterium ADurb.Bin101]|jgi:hypothetical protein|nr:MAG: hypothetical protein BWX80_00287 [Candidatus Hydrogenedentes bacterium ADurb.Bin101]